MKTRLHAPSLSQQEAQRIEEAIKTLANHGTQIYDRLNQKVFRFQVGDHQLIAKEYQFKSPSRILAALLHHSRARRSFHIGTDFLTADIPTPRPIFLIEHGHPYYKQATLVTEYFDGPTLHHFLESGHSPPPSLAHGISQIFRKLLASRLRHGDFHSRNLLINSDHEISLIDLDGARRRFSRRQTLRNLRTDRDRLLHSLADHPDFQAKLIALLGAPNTPFPKL